MRGLTLAGSQDYYSPGNQPRSEKSAESRTGISPLCELSSREIPIAPYGVLGAPQADAFSSALSATPQGIRPQRNFGSGLALKKIPPSPPLQRGAEPNPLTPLCKGG
jgi:hypothetical protein